MINSTFLNFLHLYFKCWFYPLRQTLQFPCNFCGFYFTMNYLKKLCVCMSIAVFGEKRATSVYNGNPFSLKYKTVVSKYIMRKYIRCNVLTHFRNTTYQVSTQLIWINNNLISFHFWFLNPKIENNNCNTVI